ncbi:MAG: metal-dependent hydrolase, partial [Marinobacter sp.]
MTVSFTPEGVSVKPRNLHFDVNEDLKTLWHGDDAFRTAFLNALSLQFPDGEQQFINAVRLYQDRVADPKLKAEIRGFIGQEALHSREHKAYNEALKARGYDIEGLDRRFRKHMEWVGKLSPSRQLAGTCGAEHYTAV